MEERRYLRQVAAWVAWHTAALGRAKRLPKLESLTRAPESKKDVAKRLKATMKAAFPSF